MTGAFPDRRECAGLSLQCNAVPASVVPLWALKCQLMPCLHRAALAWRGPSATTNFPKDNYDLTAIAKHSELACDGPQPNGRGIAGRSTRRSKHGEQNGLASSGKGRAADRDAARYAIAAAHWSQTPHQCKGTS